MSCSPHREAELCSSVLCEWGVKLPVLYKTQTGLLLICKGNVYIHSISPQEMSQVPKSDILPPLKEKALTAESGTGTSEKNTKIKSRRRYSVMQCVNHRESNL